MITPRQFAESRGVAYTTVMNWLQQGKLPEAVRHATPTGHYWEVPDTAAVPNSPPGRPPGKAGHPPKAQANGTPTTPTETTRTLNKAFRAATEEADQETSKKKASRKGVKK